MVRTRAAKRARSEARNVAASVGQRRPTLIENTDGRGCEDRAPQRVSGPMNQSSGGSHEATISEGVFASMRHFGGRGQGVSIDRAGSTTIECFGGKSDEAGGGTSCVDRGRPPTIHNGANLNGINASHGLSPMATSDVRDMCGNRDRGGGGPALSILARACQDDLEADFDVADDDMDESEDPPHTLNSESCSSTSDTDLDTTTKKELIPGTFWFRLNGEVTRAVTRSIFEDYNTFYPNWKETPEQQKQQWFCAFKRLYTWKPELEEQVLETFTSCARKNLKNNVSKIRRNGRKPKWMSEDVFNILRQRSQEQKFKKRSEQARKNRCSGSEDGKVCGVSHVQGSVSAIELARRMAAANNGVLPSPADFFLATHTKVDPETKEKVFINEKAAEIMTKFEHQREKCIAEGSQKSADEIFYDVVGGYNKNEVNRLGSAAELYYQKYTRSYCKKSTSYNPSEVAQLQKELEDQRKKTDKLRSHQEELLEYLKSIKPILDKLTHGCIPFPFSNQHPVHPPDCSGGCTSSCA